MPDNFGTFIYCKAKGEESEATFHAQSLLMLVNSIQNTSSLDKSIKDIDDSELLDAFFRTVAGDCITYAGKIAFGLSITYIREYLFNRYQIPFDNSEGFKLLHLKSAVLTETKKDFSISFSCLNDEDLPLIPKSWIKQ